MQTCRLCGKPLELDSPARALSLCEDCEERILERAEDLLETRAPIHIDPDWESHLERSVPKSRWEEF
ncbi:MAG: hypothetical protein H0Z37_01385 [Firmicutes bacterium]|nr:hypothetical protein [Bacillota bacterium]